MLFRNDTKQEKQKCESVKPIEKKDKLFNRLVAVPQPRSPR